MLTAVKINSAKPASKAFKLADSGGLYLLVQPSGAKLWCYKFCLGGAEGLDALGGFHVAIRCGRITGSTSQSSRAKAALSAFAMATSATARAA